MYKPYAITLKVCTILLVNFCATAEMGVHWWPCSETYNWVLRSVVAFKDSMYVLDARRCTGLHDPETGDPIWDFLQGIFSYSGCGSNLQGIGGLPDVNGRTIMHITDDRVWLFNRDSDGRKYAYWSSDFVAWDFAETDLLLEPGDSVALAHFQETLWFHKKTSEGRKIWSSEDGLHWSYQTLVPAMLSRPWRFVILHDRLLALGLVSVGDNYSTNWEFWESLDGVNWEVLPEGEVGLDNVWVQHAFVINETIWVVNSSPYEDIVGTLILRSSNAINWSYVDRPVPRTPFSGTAATAWNGRIWLYDPGGCPEVAGRTWYTEETPLDIHRADYEPDGAVSLSELLRVVQLYQAGKYQCDGSTEDSYAPGRGYETCFPHSSDYAPQDWSVDLRELLRLIQLYNMGGYHYCPDSGTEDGFCPGTE